MPKKIILSFIIGIFISLVALYFSFRNIPLAELAEYMKHINYWWIIPSTIAALGSYIFRTLRWQRILHASGYPISFKNTFHPLMIGFATNNILPARLGEIVRPLVLQQQEKMPFTTGLATVVTERVFDVGLMILSFIVITLFWHIDPSFEVTFAGYHLSAEVLENLLKNMLILALILLAGISCVAIMAIRNLLIRVLWDIPRFFKPILGASLTERLNTYLIAKIVRIIENVSNGFLLLRRPKQFLVCVLYTIIIWLVQASGYYLMMFGTPGVSLSFLDIYMVMVIILFFIALPSVPGFWGMWEAGGLFILTLMGVAASTAMGFTLINHVIQVVPIIIVGLISAAITGVNILKISKEPNAPN